MGRVVHDERGNAVWDWMKDAARVAIDSTSRLLKRLEVPELKLEDPSDATVRGDSRETGYNPYGGSSSVLAKTPQRGGVTPARGGSGHARPDPGGGYDPYGKGLTRKPRR